ncbi:hypothetical protein T459_01892 [Capsicum annuum]|uniref:Ubiquitin-like protease family profile domain-containing protein n=1 Tax=Capsicum annuum TaxID=4072 RepID=A0A2G3AII2_CAPAN|nr:hypothetical protein T459_01892 [Capsicum annuum]
MQTSMQEDYTKLCVVARNEESITNTINRLSISVGLPWHIVDEVYIPINCGKKFHWVLAVIVLKKRVIRMYDSLLGTRNRDPSTEIYKLSVTLPTYLFDSVFFEKIERTDWTNLNAYKDKLGQHTQIVNQHPFDVEYVQNIAQQTCASL